MSIVSASVGRVRRHKRLRKKISGCDQRPRLAVFKSNANIYAQLINDKTGETIVSASSLEKDLKGKCGGRLNKEVAALVGKTVAERAVAKGVKSVVFDRGGFIYHGRIKSIADAARQAGLEF